MKWFPFKFKWPFVWRWAYEFKLQELADLLERHHRGMNAQARFYDTQIAALHKQVTTTLEKLGQYCSLRYENKERHLIPTIVSFRVLINEEARAIIAASCAARVREQILAIPIDEEYRK